MSSIELKPAQVLDYLSKVQKNQDVSSGFLLTPDIFSNRGTNPYPQSSKSLGWIHAALKNTETHQSVIELAAEIIHFHSSILFRFNKEAPETKYYNELEARINSLMDTGLLDVQDAELLKNHVSELKQLSLQIYPLDKLNIQEIANRLSEKYSCSSSKGDGPVSRFMASRKSSRMCFRTGGIAEILSLKLFGSRPVSQQILPESISLNSKTCKQALAARLEASILYSRLMYQGLPTQSGQKLKPGVALYKSSLNSTERELNRLGHAVRSAKQTVVEPIQWNDFETAFNVWNPLNKLKIATVHVLTAARSNSTNSSTQDNRQSSLIELSARIDQKLATYLPLQAGTGKCNTATVDVPVTQRPPKQAGNAKHSIFKIGNFELINQFFSKPPQIIDDLYRKTRLDINADILKKSQKKSPEQEAEMTQKSKVFDLLKNTPAQQRFILNSHSDIWPEIVSKHLVRELNVPDFNQYDLLPWRGWNRDNAEPRSSNHLTHLTSESHLILIGHGRENQFEGYTAKALASRLHQAGLREAGVIEFKSCNIGKENYLQDLAEEFKQAGIRVNYLMGFDGALYTDRHQSINHGCLKSTNTGRQYGSDSRYVTQKPYSTMIVREQDAARIVQGLV